MSEILNDKPKKVKVKKNEKEKASIVEYLFDWMDSLVVVLVAVVLVFTFFLGKVRVDGESMENTLHDNDQLIISSYNYIPKAGDIVIVSRDVKNDVDSLKVQSNQPIVKRVVAVEGQKVKIEDGYLYVDGVKQDETYTKDGITDNKGFYGEHTVPDGCVFVLGDNRLDSHDSRGSDIGFIDTRYLLGKVVARVYPFNFIELF